VLRVFVAEGESAWDTTRPVFEECLDFIQKNKGRVTVLAVQDISRFSRNIQVQAVTLARLKKLGVNLVSVDEPMLDSSPVGLLTSTILGDISQFYSHSLSSRVRYRLWSRDVARWFGRGLSVADPFVCRCLTSPAMLPFPHPAHRTGRADFPHPALGERFTRSPTGDGAAAC
jgi:hypothetical protein